MGSLSTKNQEVETDQFDTMADSVVENLRARDWLTKPIPQYYPFDPVPTPILVIIFSYLDMDLLEYQVKFVCKSWALILTNINYLVKIIPRHHNLTMLHHLAKTRVLPNKTTTQFLNQQITKILASTYSTYFAKEFLECRSLKKWGLVTRPSLEHFKQYAYNWSGGRLYWHIRCEDVFFYIYNLTRDPEKRKKIFETIFDTDFFNYCRNYINEDDRYKFSTDFFFWLIREKICEFHVDGFGTMALIKGMAQEIQELVERDYPIYIDKDEKGQSYYRITKKCIATKEEICDRVFSTLIWKIAGIFVDGPWRLHTPDNLDDFKERLKELRYFYRNSSKQLMQENFVMWLKTLFVRSWRNYYHDDDCPAIAFEATEYYVKFLQENSDVHPLNTIYCQDWYDPSIQGFNRINDKTSVLVAPPIRKYLQDWNGPRRIYNKNFDK